MPDFLCRATGSILLQGPSKGPHNLSRPQQSSPATGTGEMEWKADELSMTPWSQHRNFPPLMKKLKFPLPSGRRRRRFCSSSTTTIALSVKWSLEDPKFESGFSSLRDLSENVCLLNGSWSRDVVKFSFASPPKRKLFAFNFEASRGLGQEIGNTHQERAKDKQWPTKGYTDWATLILQKGDEPLDSKQFLLH